MMRLLPIAFALLSGLALAAPVASAAAPGAEFELPQRSRQSNLFAFDAFRQPIDAGWLKGVEHSDWPYRGFEVSSHSSLYPIYLAVGQSVDFAVPVLPWLAPMVRVEGTAGLIFTGMIFDVGARARIDSSDNFGVFFEGTGRFGIGELTLAEIFEDFYEEHVDAHIDQVAGFGFSVAGGVELGGPNTRFTLGAALSYLFLDAALRLGDDVNVGLPTITVTSFGFTFGVRFFFR